MGHGTCGTCPPDLPPLRLPDITEPRADGLRERPVEAGSSVELPLADGAAGSVAVACVVAGSGLEVWLCRFVSWRVVAAILVKAL